MSSSNVLDSNTSTEDSLIQNKSNENDHIESFTKTSFTWIDSNGDAFPVYISKSGSCFVIKSSRNGSDYRVYLGKEVSEQIVNAIKIKSYH